LEYLWIILGILFLLGGLLGCFLPILPGPPLAYASLLFAQLTDEKHFTTNFLIVWGLIVVGVTALDYFIPPLATKKFGGTRYGIIGSTLGIIVGIFVFPPLGIIVFPFVFAFLAELIGGSENSVALKAAMGSFLGFVTGVLIKLTVTITIGYYFFTAIF